MNWNRGMFRVWIVASVVWVIAYVLMQLAATGSYFDLIIRQCESMLGDDAAWRACYDEQSNLRDRYFWNLMASLEIWLFVLALPVVALIVGKIAMIIVGWVARGFVRG